MNIIEEIQENAQLQNWPFPKTFEALKTAGVTSYIVHLTQSYHVVFQGSFGSFKKTELKGYHPLQTSQVFCDVMTKEAIIRHIEGKTNYLELLEDLSMAGISHYQVDMQSRKIRYFNPAETKYHLEIVPVI